jgi:D-glycero-D-manno-heptose 1,7-bisphosphate phosphatase
MNKAVFLDRDGTIIEDRDYLADPEGVVLLPGVVEGLRRLREAGYLLVVVTNQSGAARGYFTETDIHGIHDELAKQLVAEGIALDAFYYCPHGPTDGCRCRKPLPGMTLQAAAEWNIDLAASVTIGDKLRDVEAGTAAGCGTNILLGEDSAWSGPQAASLIDAVSRVLGLGS